MNPEILNAINKLKNNSLMNKAQSTTNQVMKHQAINGNKFTPGQAASFGINAMPFVGDMIALEDSKKDFQKGNYGMSAFNAVTALPMIGDIASAAKMSLPAIGGLAGLAHLMSRSGGKHPVSPFSKQAGVIGYHGSPHKFDKFSSEGIGTGEGAQAYGHGLYFAESPDVAKGYQEGLSKQQHLTNDGKQWRVVKDDDNIYNIMESVSSNTSKLPTAVPNGYEQFDSFYSDQFKSPEDAFNYLKEKNNLPDSYKLIPSEDGIEYGGLVENQGNLYKVDIDDAAVDTFLDWDKPLSEQSEAAKRAILEIAENNPSHFGGVANAIRTGKKGGAWDKYKGRDFYQAITDISATDRVKQTATATGFELSNSGMKDASQQLNTLGVKGIRYLDGMSRGAEKGTSNFVTFDDSIIKMLERN